MGDMHDTPTLKLRFGESVEPVIRRRISGLGWRDLAHELRVENCCIDLTR